MRIIVYNNRKMRIRLGLNGEICEPKRINDKKGNFSKKCKTECYSTIRRETASKYKHRGQEKKRVSKKWKIARKNPEKTRKHNIFDENPVVFIGEKVDIRILFSYSILFNKMRERP